MKNKVTNRLKEIFLSPMSIMTTLLGLVAYYYLFTYINEASFFMLTASIYLVYALVITSALLLTAGIYSIRKRFARAKTNFTGAPASVVTSAFGSMMSCGCHYSLFASFLGFIGLGAEVGTITGLDLFYSNYFVALFIIINIGVLYYVVMRIK